MKLLLILIVLSLIGLGVKGAETWTSESFGGSVEVSKTTTWYSESFGGFVEVEDFPYDIDEDGDVDLDDIQLVVSALGESGDYIDEDVNVDFIVDYLDIGGVCFWYPWN